VIASREGELRSTELIAGGAEPLSGFRSNISREGELRSTELIAGGAEPY